MFKLGTLAALVMALALTLTHPATSIARPRHYHGRHLRHHIHYRHHVHWPGLHIGFVIGAPYWPLPYWRPPVYHHPRIVVVQPPPSPPVAIPGIPAPSDTATDRSTCREYTTTVIIGGEPQQAYGTACLQADGTWKRVD